MPLRRPSLHRRPAVDALLLLAAVTVAIFLLRASVARTPRMVVVSDPTRFNAPAALYNTRLLADSFQNRLTGTPTAKVAAAWLVSRFDQLGLAASEQRFPLVLSGQAREGRNVIGRTGGRERGAIVLLAHYDGPTTSSQSAAASASGVGTLLELARILESRPHRHPFVYVALDAGTWGQVGAAHVVDELGGPDSVLAAISIDHVANGASAGIVISGVGQGHGYAPLWLRAAAADAFAQDGTPFHDVGPLEEWYLRTIRLSEEDHGPLVARGIAAINLGTRPADPNYALFLFHTPGDRVETLDSAAFRQLGTGIERLVLSLDRDQPLSGSFVYLRVGADRLIRGAAIVVAAILLFLPLLLTMWQAITAARIEPAARASLGAEAAIGVGWWAIAGLGWVALRGLVVSGFLPRFEIYPATERDPFLFDAQWLPMLAWVTAMIAVAYLLARVRRRLRLKGSHPFAGRAVALATLVVLVAIALVVNPFGAVWLLMLPAWLWPWIGPTRRAMTGAAGALLVLLSAVPALVIAFLVGQHFELGVRTGWYLFLQSAYGAWNPLTTIMAGVALLAAWRLVGTATARLLPDSGD